MAIASENTHCVSLFQKQETFRALTAVIRHVKIREAFVHMLGGGEEEATEELVVHVVQTRSRMEDWVYTGRMAGECEDGDIYIIRSPRRVSRRRVGRIWIELLCPTVREDSVARREQRALRSGTFARFLHLIGHEHVPIACALFAILLAADAGPRELPVTSRGNSTRTRRELTDTNLAGCGSGNPIDVCWQCDPNWESHREKLADCVIGFGSGTIGGRNGAIYVVTDAGNDNPTDPKPGTLRYAVIQDEPLWITFGSDMHIELEEELIVTSFKTIDGRGADVHLTTSITIQEVEHVIIHGLHIHDCKPTGPAEVRSSKSHVGHRQKTDGDGITVLSSSHIWIDHNSFSSCTDGLVDVTHGSDAVSITNNYFSNHDKVMLLGSHDDDYEDKSMRVTVAFNYFGPGLVQRLPRCRLGTFQVLNNFYKEWSLYAIGGSANPTVSSEGNHFEAGGRKEVSKYVDNTGNWRSVGDLFLNGARFTPLGEPSSSSVYASTKSFTALPASQVPTITANAGPTS
ncbi:hypothetical protein R1sor_017147 [Riccia sorocarpa]|uniref:Pectate lyase n=1 Tax=Riccia sorocarpa TaxID=122646 RepID=A0ABD3I9R8_9MARC